MKLDLFIYNSQHLINTITLYQLNHLNATSFSFIFLSGLFTSLSPCVISILPVCILYISGENQKLTSINKIKNLLIFCLGTISSFITLGVVATLLTKTYSQFFNGLPIISAIIIIYMGFNSLNIVPLESPKFDGLANNSNYYVKMYLGGVGVGTAISSCSTPIFITLLVWINSLQKIFIGLIFILIYSLGYIFPIIIGSIFSSNFLKLKHFSVWNNLWAPFSGTILLSTGTFSLFSSLFSNGSFFYNLIN
uniref:cytochrome c biogenesis protein transmembrane region n=1 Tax=Pyropia seriata TaxID=79731 RepID=UPI00286C1C15|nr:cytochrome c biogenesis protein transmembrane region [Neoporphyra seriata]WKD84125.1 cytochrome c biogenesis protein transmembrane region [Neoporphyra seriata]